ncbi:MaoC family dehydratase [Corynebacterium falsenii]|uniref:MaoC family dehydratase n=1 Tax=Corynebacterium falsenii TaxID=108486 RepID=UPI001DEB87C6|nr:MaoC family dehydratase [Corynebacterium falsenii]HJF11591.1 MaoC family dehydratase [Corynebacterium falsenii]
MTTPAPEQAVVQRGLWFEEFQEGTTYLHRPGRTITEADNTLFTTQTMNTQPLHLDAAWAATQPGFRGERLVNSMLTLSTVVGLSVSQLTLGTIVANLGFKEITFPAPMFHGDTLYAETKVIGKRLSSSRPNQGIVELHHIGRNQEGTVVCTATRSTMMQCRPVADAPEVPDAPEMQGGQA